LLNQEKISKMEDEFNPHDLPETTATEIIDKIAAMAWQIRKDWTDPWKKCRAIVRLTEKLKEFL
jgi:hypothetical protein